MIGISKEAYEKLIQQDIDWLLGTTMHSLERDHIILVLKDSIKRIYEHPDYENNDKTIEKFINLFYDANRYIRMEVNNEFNLNKLKEEQIKYIKEHWND